MILAPLALPIPFRRRWLQKIATLICAGLAAVALFPLKIMAADKQGDVPNIVLILVDDLGYGDLGCYGATRVKTPHLDALAATGLRFTDGHSSSATCTPSRFALLTGEYPWRKKGTGIAPGDATLIIPPDTVTLPSLLQASGYTTGVVGKWHLGLGQGKPDWNGELKPGPLEIGFDYCFLIPATGDRVPCVYVENHRVVGLNDDDPISVSFAAKIGDEPTGRANPELLKLHPSHGHDMTIVNGISRIGWMTGGQKARWVDEDMADTITAKATAFIEHNREKPFFLYFATQDVHVPRTPHARFVGSTPMGPRGDAIVQLDWCVGQIMKKLDELKLTENTLVIFSSDNGPVVNDGYKDESIAKLGDHKPAGPWRGGKYSSFEGGTRVPLIARWPARIKPGLSDALICQVDFPATLAAIAHHRREIPDGALPDSLDMAAALCGDDKVGRKELVEHAGELGLREGDWKFIPASAKPKRSPSTNTELGNDAAGQLYDLRNDPGEKTNVAAEHADRARKMAARLDEIRAAGRSR